MRTETISSGLVRGVLQRPEECCGGIVLAHGAGSDCDSPLVTAVARAFAETGFASLRIDLPFRQERPKGPPHPGTAARDRAALREAAELLRPFGSVCLAGHSYGGRQASMLAAEDPALARSLLLLSYPLHPPRRPDQPRTKHFPELRTPSLFVHGSRDPFGSPAEMEAALSLLPVAGRLIVVDGAGHELKPVVRSPMDIVARFLAELL